MGLVITLSGNNNNRYASGHASSSNLMHDAKIIAVSEAEEARARGTFGVGGVLIDEESGEIIHSIGNNVIVNGKVHDHSAHAERQLIDWYYEEQARRKENGKKLLPEPNKLTIVTSLEPCVMCSGCILHTGFKTLVISEDKFTDISSGKDILPKELQQKADQQIHLMRVKEGNRIYDKIASIVPVIGKLLKFAAKNIGTAINMVKEQVLDRLSMDKTRLSKESASAEEITRATMAFNSGEAIRQVLDEIAERDKENKPNTEGDEYTKQTYKQLSENWPKIVGDLAAPLQKMDNSSLERLLDAASRRAKRSGLSDSGDAAAILDKNGHLLMIATGQESKSPIRTALMELERAYSAALENAPEGVNLPNTKDCKIVLLKQPRRNAEGIINAGLAISMRDGFEGNAPLYYVQDYKPNPKDKDQSDPLTEKDIAKFPALYTSYTKLSIEKINLPNIEKSAARTAA